MINKEIQFRSKTFWAAHFPGRSQFFRRWVRSGRHVFLDFQGHLFYLATEVACAEVIQQLRPGDIAVCPIRRAEFLNAVRKVVA
jgi:hypothetical protein